MLTSSTLNVAYPLAEQIDANAIVIRPLGGTALDHLVKASKVTEDMAGTGENGSVYINTFDLEFAANQKAPRFDKSQHDFVMDDVVIASAGVIQRVVSITRNQVAPMIGQLVDTVSMRMQSISPSELAAIEISAADTVGVLYNSAIADLIEKYQLLSVNEPQINTSLPRLAASEIIPLLETGIDTLDKDIAEWVAGINAYTLENIWESFFCRLTSQAKDDGIARISSNDSFSSLMERNPEAPLVIFIIARNLFQNEKVLDNTQTGLAAYLKTLQAFMEQSGVLLNRQIEKNNVSIKNGVLVSGISELSKINVNTPVYNTWLSNGGDNDVLFGMLVSGKPAYTVNLINERADEYRHAWNNYVAVITAADSNRKFNYLREQLTLCFEAILLDEETDGRKADVNVVFGMMKVFKEELAKFSLLETNDLYNVCMKLVCRSRFNETAAEFILTKMEEISKANPKLPVREVGTIAVISYICEWVSSQFIATGI